MPKSNTGKIAAGLGAATLTAAAAASAYYFLGSKGKQHRQKAEAWVKAAKQDMLKKIKSMEKVSKQTYEQAVLQVMAKYKQAKKLDSLELKNLADELKGHWNAISTEVSKLTKNKVKPSSKNKKSSKKRN